METFESNFDYNANMKNVITKVKVLFLVLSTILDLMLV